jgi:hypothetical protein
VGLNLDHTRNGNRITSSGKTGSRLFAILCISPDITGCNERHNVRSAIAQPIGFPINSEAFSQYVYSNAYNFVVARLQKAIVHTALMYRETVLLPPGQLPEQSQAARSEVWKRCIEESPS